MRVQDSEVRVVVSVEDWQFQCCGDDFAIGDTVSWRLVGGDDDWVATTLGDHAPPPVGRLPVIGQLAGDMGAGTVVGIGDLRVFLADRGQEPAVEQADRWVGQLSEDHHVVGAPEDLPLTTAVVSRIRLVRVGYHDDPVQQAQVPTPGTATTEDVDPAPRWPEERVAGRRFIGFLVDLDVSIQGSGQRTRGTPN